MGVRIHLDGSGYKAGIDLARAAFCESSTLPGTTLDSGKGSGRAARRGLEKVEQLAMTGPALVDIAGADPAAEQHGKEKHGTDDDCSCPIGK